MTEPLHDADASVEILEVAEVNRAKRRWHLALMPDALVFTSPEDETHTIARAEWPNFLHVIEYDLILRRAVVAKLKKHVVLQFTPETFAALTAYLGPPTPLELRATIARRTSFLPTLGGVFIFLSLPIGPIAADWTLTAFGVMLIATALAAKRWPHHNFFAAETLEFTALAVISIVELVSEFNGWRFAMLFFLISGVLSSWREYRRFAASGTSRAEPTELSAAPEPPAPPDEADSTFRLD